MYLAVQPQLVEQVVFEAVRRDPALEPLYHRQFAACHEHQELDRRDRAFQEMHERWFTELGLRDLIAGLAAEFPHFLAGVSRLMIAQAPTAKAQTMELYGAPQQHSVVAAVAAESLLDRPAFLYWARHEFQHVDDMLDPSFGHDMSHRPGGPTRAAENLAQDRYAVLWAMSVDARLEARGQTNDDVKRLRRGELARAFGIRNGEDAQPAFERLWTLFSKNRPTHGDMLEMAAAGLAEARAADAARETPCAPLPGSACPLCSFPTHDWAAHAELEAATPAIMRDFPNWSIERGACGRCLEVYRASTTAAEAACV